MCESLVLYYGHDPMCSYCWAFRPVWRAIKASIASDYPHIEIISLLGGLAPDSDEPMPEQTRQMISNAWRHIEQQIPGTQFNFDFWHKQKPRRSTYPACRAVSAAKLLNPALEDEMILAIQQAYYVKAQNPSDDDTLIGCAQTIGLDADEFADVYQSIACGQAFRDEMRFARSIGIYSFPSLVLAKGSSRFSIAIDYNSADNMLTSLHDKEQALLA